MYASIILHNSQTRFTYNNPKLCKFITKSQIPTLALRIKSYYRKTKSYYKYHI